MSEHRKMEQYFVASDTQDGAGVKMRRIFWREDTLDMDPFLLLDMFDHKDPKDYIKGFPTHPHRGIQTFTYLISGKINHRDSLGNAGSINDYGYQWMNSGSGILHEEMPQTSDYMLGYQLWINLPAKEKMSQPAYIDGTKDNIVTIEEDGYTIHLLTGAYKDKKIKNFPAFVNTNIYDIEIMPDTTVLLEVDKTHHLLLATLQGSIIAAGEEMVEKSAATFTGGDVIEISTGEEGARVEFFSGERLNEPIAWAGPIVMNTREELVTASRDLKNNTFVKHEIKNFEI